MYQVQAYLHACLESVLSQSFTDLELIAVDDCSPDACGAITEEFAARDPRVRPVHLPENQGLGRARNAGMAGARGDYLDFLDGDDTLTPDALRAIADRVRWRPVLFRRMVDHFRTVFTRPGRLPRGCRAEFLRRARTYYRRYRTTGVPVPPRSRLRYALVRLGLHRTFRGLQRAMALRRRAAKVTAKSLRALRAALLQLHHRVQPCLPLRADRAAFAAYWGRGHGCKPGAPEAAFRASAPHVRTAWIVRPEHHHTIPAGTRPITPNTGRVPGPLLPVRRRARRRAGGAARRARADGRGGRAAAGGSARRAHSRTRTGRAPRPLPARPRAPTHGPPAVAESL